MNEKTAEKKQPLVRILLPRAEESGDGPGTDQTEQVILNGRVTSIRRGEYVDVKPAVYMALRQRYKDI